jgi:hypothetical protein
MAEGLLGSETSNEKSTNDMETAPAVDSIAA